ncbi:hypothetical protein CH63R_04597 [Colletotrichum higginsianum IMI 349063]|uniref:Uncharacterized protein n=1 Tax=Colletotrichum higginsianum (strain IMI 349063) TaxID=759273 RepID=A0A1B7YJP6_COLHI|nr:hypothetical protein CH63R_04597 [Colletotrichum higginsianum IMI 349063]OBR12301.1 hypothetical protein CH63R_04597 [Colletotrichum higginsianum IMI 349063]
MAGIVIDSTPGGVFGYQQKLACRRLKVSPVAFLTRPPCNASEPVGARVAGCSEYVAAVNRRSVPKHQDCDLRDKEALSTLAPRFPNSWNQESFVARVIAPSPETPLSEPATTRSRRFSPSGVSPEAAKRPVEGSSWKWGPASVSSSNPHQILFRSLLG